MRFLLTPLDSTWFQLIPTDSTFLSLKSVRKMSLSQSESEVCLDRLRLLGRPQLWFVLQDLDSPRRSNILGWYTYLDIFWRCGTAQLDHVRVWSLDSSAVSQHIHADIYRLVFRMPKTLSLSLGERIVTRSAVVTMSLFSPTLMRTSFWLWWNFYKFLCYWVSKGQMLVAIAKCGMTLVKSLLEGLKDLQGPSNCISMHFDRVLLCAGAHWWWARPWQGHQVQCTCCLPSSTSVATPGHHIGCLAVEHSALLDSNQQQQESTRDKWSWLLLSIQAMQQAEDIGEANTWSKENKMSYLMSDTWRVLPCFSAPCHMCVRNKRGGIYFAKAFGTHRVLQKTIYIACIAVCEGSCLAFVRYFVFPGPLVWFWTRVLPHWPKDEMAVGMAKREVSRQRHRCLAKRPKNLASPGTGLCRTCQQPRNLRFYAILEHLQYLRYIYLQLFGKTRFSAELFVSFLDS